MLDPSLIQTIGLVVIAAAASMLLARLLFVPSIVAYLIAGLVVGPLLRRLPEAWHAPAPAVESLAEIAEIGVALLLFLVGLELSLAKVRHVGPVALAAGIGQMLLTAAGGLGLALLLGLGATESIVVAVALTFSSTVVVVKVLDQKGELDTLYGRIAVAILLVQDLVVILVLSVLAGLGAGEEMTLESIALGSARALVGMSGLLGLVLVAARFLLPRPFDWVARSPRALVVWSLAWCFLLVALSEALGVSPAIGAFLAGVSLAQLRCSPDLRRRVHPLMNFFVAVFFVTLGAQIRVTHLAEHWAAALVLSLFVLLGKAPILMWMIARFGYGERTAFRAGVALAQVSEFSFVVAAAGLAAGLVDESILSLIAMVGLLTILMSVLMIMGNARLYDALRQRHGLAFLRARAATDEEPPARQTEWLEGHVVVVGMNALGRLVAQALHERGETVLAIDTDPSKLDGLPCRTLHGNVEYGAVLDDAGLSRAAFAITALRIEDTNNLFVLHCHALGIPVAAHAFDRSVIPALHRLAPSHIIRSKDAADRRIEALLRELGVLAR